MVNIRNILRKIVYSVEFRPWTPAEKRTYQELSGLRLLPKLLAPQYVKRRFRPQLFLAQLRMEMGKLVEPEWYTARYLSNMPGVNPVDYFVAHGTYLRHMPNEFIDLEQNMNDSDYWLPSTVAEFLLRRDWDKAFIGDAFSPGTYLDLYPDIRKGKVNPLLHFVQNGQNEGRLAKSAMIMAGNGAISYNQLFNANNGEAEWLNIRGTISSTETAAIEISYNNQIIGNARLSIPEVKSVKGSTETKIGFQYSSELKVRNENDLIVLQSVSFSGKRKVLCEIDLQKEKKSIDQIPVEDYYPRTRNNSKNTDGKSFKKILILTHHLGIGGGQLYLQEVLRGLADLEGIEITVVSMVGGVLEDELRDLGFDVIVFQGPKPFSKNNYEQFLWDFDQLFINQHFDLFIANTTGCFAQVDWCIRNNIKGYWSIHESYSLHGWAMAAFGRQIDEYVFERLQYSLTNVQTLVFEAQGTLDIVMANLPKDNCIILKYGIEVPKEPIPWKQLDPKSRIATFPKLNLVSVGTFEERKAQGLIVLLAKYLQDHNYEVQFDLVGYKPGDYYSDAISKAVSNLGLEKIVRLHEVTANWEQYLEGADFFFMPSDVESMPQSMMIAMAYGVPAIGSRVYGIPELVTDGYSGFVHEPNNLSDMVRVIDKALELSESEYLAMRAFARDFIISNHEKSSYVDYFKQKVQSH